VPVIVDQLRTLAKLVPDEVGFVVVGGGEITYADWDAHASRVARGLIELGVAKGDRVALVIAAEDALRFVTAYAGVHKAAAVAVPVNVRLSAGEIAGILRHCEPSVVVVSESLVPLLAQAELPKHVVTTGAATGAAIAWDDLLADDADDIQVDADFDDLAEVLYTSGTTGTPKGVAIRHGNSAMNVLSEPQWSGSNWIHASPMSTFAGLTFVYQPMRMGMRTVYIPRFDVETWAAAIDEHKPMCAFIVPAMAELMIAHPLFDELDMSSLLMVSVGSAPSAPTTLQRLQEKMPNAAIANGYSMTEAGAAYCVLPKGELEKRPGAVGLPLPPTEIRIVSEEGADVAPGEVGEVLLKPPGRQREYYRDPEATAALWRDGWVHTGDLGRRDDDGYLYIVGRIKDVIIRGGNNVYATDVEAALYEHPDVREAAVVGVPHPVLGEDVAAFVVLRDGATASADDLVAHCREHLSDYKVPRQVQLRDELPRNATGKVLKRELRLG
jgi:acyl-CoA synthetase (AMP-forming)/AMP-acid ligase II